MSKKKSPQRPVAPSPKRKALFFAFTIAFPFLLLLLLEGSLRLLHYGTDISLFITEERGGKQWEIMNPDVKARYFSHVEFSPNTSHDYFLMPKPAGVYRIFALGGSTTAGFPYGPSGTFSTFLRHRLSALLPKRNVEVINLGMTATNSFTALDIARELPAYDPDLVIVYDGHNEFYGALGAASHESVGSSRTFTLAYLRLGRLKTFQLLRSAIDRVKSTFAGTEKSPSYGTMMEQLARNEYVPFGSDLYLRCRENYLANMRDMVAILRDHRIPVILSTQASSLRDQEPFISRHAPGFPRERVAEYDRTFAEAQSLYARSSFDSTRALAAMLVGQDSLFADAQFLLGRSLDALRQSGQARAAYTRARDFDELRFRMSSDFNDAVRSLGAPPAVIVADIDSAFAHRSPDGITGRELIIEHLHPNLDGVAAMAEVYAHLICANGLPKTGGELPIADTIGDGTMAGMSLMTQLDSAAAARRIATLTSSWPFSREVALPSPRLDARFLPMLDRIVSGKSTWEEAHVGFAQAYIAEKDTLHAEREYAAIVDQLPHNVSAYLFLGQLYHRQQRFPEAFRILRASLEEERTPYALRILGSIELDSLHADAAVGYLKASVDLSTDARERVQSGYLLALAYARSADSAAARDELANVLRISPSFRPALDLQRKLAPSLP